jgi:nicotinate-nucleotide adenylyltransferase
LDLKPGATTRLGVFGGAFDPPHVAHVALAQAAVEQLRLDQLRIFPTGQAWHRSGPLTAPEHRLALAQLAFGELPRTVIDDRELRRPGPTYTIDTLRELKAEQPAAQLFLVMGEDQAVALTRRRALGPARASGVAAAAAAEHARKRDRGARARDPR